MPLELVISGLLVPVENDGPAACLEAAALRLKVPAEELTLVKILSKCPAFGDTEQFYYDLSVAVGLPDGYGNEEKFPVYSAKTAPAYIPARAGERPVIIGFGPAGMFAALELIEYGLKPLIFERGRKLEERDADVQRFISRRELTPDSNIQFGEGGAGSYSDGKLFSRLNNSAYASRVLDTFIKFGAPPEIGYISKPHLGTDVLRGIVVNIRNHILERGGEINFGSKLTGLLMSGGEVSGVEINNSARHSCSAVYLAVGNSARDTFAMLHKSGIALEAKPVSVGVRLEHPAETINLIRYGEKYKSFPGLGAAVYSFNYTNRKTGRGAYTFCMCPGGEVVNASSEEGLLALNGMSYAARGSAFSNAGIVVTCRTADYGSAHPLAGVEFQKEIERKAFLAGGGDWRAPAQNLRDFMGGALSSALNVNSLKTGTRSADLKSVFPAFITETLLSAFRQWETECPLFVGGDAIIIAPETRTSSPVKMPRGGDFQSLSVRNLYPIGEGSGYTGGITSAASDALKAVEAAQLAVR